MISFEEVGFGYDESQFVLNDIDLSIEAGQYVCIIGGNGSGKSTLAKHINALLLPDTGTVKIFGMDTSSEDLLYLIRCRAGMVFQNPDDQLVASLVENDVAFGPENMGIDTQELRKRVSLALAEVGLSGFEKHEVSTLSGGQKQRVAIAGILAMRPSILVLDEASAMLDPRGRAGLLKVCKKLHEAGMTIISITHFMDEAACAERVIALRNGSIACDGTPEEVLSQPQLLRQIALDVPFAASLSLSLIEKGLPLSVHIDTESLKEELCALLLKA